MESLPESQEKNIFLAFRDLVATINRGGDTHDITTKILENEKDFGISRYDMLDIAESYLATLTARQPKDNLGFTEKEEVLNNLADELDIPHANKDELKASFTAIRTAVKNLERRS